MVSLGHDTGPASLTHKGSLSQLTQLPFSCGGGWVVLIFALCILGNISGEPQGRAASCQDYTASERTTEAALESLETSENRAHVPGFSLQ